MRNERSRCSNSAAVSVSSILKTCSTVSLLGRTDLLLDTSISSYHSLVKTSAPPPPGIIIRCSNNRQTKPYLPIINLIFLELNYSLMLRIKVDIRHRQRSFRSIKPKTEASTFLYKHVEVGDTIRVQAIESYIPRSQSNPSPVHVIENMLLE